MKSRGYTLVEVIVVLVIIGIMFSVAVSIGGCNQFFFAEETSGTVVANEQLGSGNAGFFASQDAKTIAFSRAVEIKNENGESIVFSTVDRQFSVVKPGDCVKAKIFKYPPWNFEKAGTYYNGRLLRKWECAKSVQ